MFLMEIGAKHVENMMIAMQAPGLGKEQCDANLAKNIFFECRKGGPNQTRAPG